MLQRSPTVVVKAGSGSVAATATYREEDVLLVLVDSTWVGDGITVLDHRHGLSWKREHDVKKHSWNRGFNP